MFVISNQISPPWLFYISPHTCLDTQSTSPVTLQPATSPHMTGTTGGTPAPLISIINIYLSFLMLCCTKPLEMYN